MQGNLLRVADETALGGQSSVKGTGGAAFVADRTGNFGVVVETGTTAVTGSFSMVQILEDATFTVFIETGVTGDAMTGFSIPAGTVLAGNITAFTLSSGKVRAYKAG